MTDWDDRPTVTEKTPVITPEGEKHYLYPSGGIHNERGRIVKPAPHTAITPQTAAELQAASVAARYKNAVNAARKGLERGVAATALVKDYGMAWEHIVAAQAELAMTPDMGHASTKAAEFVGKAADMLPDRRVSASRDEPGRVDDRLLAFLGALAPVIRDVVGSDNSNYRNHDVIDVTPGDVAAGDEDDSGDV